MVVATKAGTGTLTFTDANNGTFNYVIGAVNQTRPSPARCSVLCRRAATATQPDLATRHQLPGSVVERNPATSESGWGINLNHESDTIFATWFTYDIDGSPLWLVVTAHEDGARRVQRRPVPDLGCALRRLRHERTLVPAKVGTATFTFTDGNNATFIYTVQLAGMAAPVTQSEGHHSGTLLDLGNDVPVDCEAMVWRRA